VPPETSRDGQPPAGLHRVLQETRKIIASVPRAFGLVWNAGPALTAALLLLNLLSSFSPVLTLWLTKLTIDRIALMAGQEGGGMEFRPLWVLIGGLGLVWLLGRALESLGSTLSNLLRFRVEIHTQTLIMRKCADLDVVFFENPKNLDMLENASRGAMMSAWSLVWMLFSLVRTGVTLGTFLVALVRLHWLAMAVVALTTAPQMLSSSYFARRRWKMMTDRAEDSRLRYYLSWLMSQRDPAKEVRIFGLAEYVIERFKFYCQKFFRQERDLEGRRELINFLLGALGNLGAAGVWVYVALRAVARTITMGDVVFYTQAVSSCQGNLLSLFTQGGVTLHGIRCSCSRAGH
jgi:ATP-binding cassette subfamily B protein